MKTKSEKNKKIKKIVKVPSEGGCLKMNIGCRNAPDEIVSKLGVKSSCIYIDKDNIEKTFMNISKATGDIFIGGDHSITYSLVKGFKEKIGLNFGLIMFDSHPDCVNNFSPPSHEDFIRVLIEEGVVKAENILLIGLRSIDNIEMKFLIKNKIKRILMKDILSGKLDVNRIIKNFINRFEGIYLSCDIDVLDSKIVPGTGYPVSKGFMLNDLINVLRIVRDSKKVSRMDLVEINPDKDINGVTVGCGVEILKVFL
ncbi:arginase family protein [Candidatus Pacearchaeota archaeon]|nr:arginase family protein [Candidatus Pacearchaeota archaeon]